MTTKWILREPVAPPPELIAEVGGHRLVAELLAQRGILSAEKARSFLDPAHYTPAPPQALFGLENAAQGPCHACRATGMAPWIGTRCG